MRIAFEASSYTEKKPSGVAIYLRNFIEGFERLDSGHSSKIFYRITRIRHRKYWYKSASMRTQTYYKSLLPVYKNIDIFHGLDCYVPDWKSSRKLVNVYDIYNSINNDDLIAPKDFREKKESELGDAVRISDLVITCSENTRQDVLEFYQIPESKVVNVYPGIDSAFDTTAGDSEEMRRVYGLDREYLLFLGAISGRKNTANLVGAFAKSKAAKDFDLVLVGNTAYKSELTYEAIERNRISDKVRMIGYIPNEHKAAIYKGARGFVFPTFYEGFGFPILEAMLCGTPVLTSNVGSAPEVGGDHALYVDPSDIDSITEGIDRLVEWSDYDVVSAKNHAETFSWDKTAAEMLKIYTELNEGKR